LKEFLSGRRKEEKRRGEESRKEVDYADATKQEGVTY
jgi:hypothetical protein